MIADNSGMNNRRLGRLIKKIATEIDGQDGYWKFSYGGRKLMTISDEGHNRMRVMTPVVEATALGKDDLHVLLAANFDRALDAKYAIAQDLLWAVFMHPLQQLADDQFFDAVQQVAALADNYGTSYASSPLVFGG